MVGKPASPSICPVHLSTVLAPLVLGLARSTPASAAYVQGAAFTRHCPVIVRSTPPPHLDRERGESRK